MNQQTVDSIVALTMVKSAVYLGVMLVIIRLARRASGTSRSHLFRTTLVGLLGLAALGLGKPLWSLNLGQFFGEPAIAAGVAAPASTEGEWRRTSPGLGIADDGVVPVSGEKTTSPRSWFAAIWLAGAVFCLARFLASWTRTVQLRSSSRAAEVNLPLPSNVSVRTHGGIGSPLSFGMGRPVILLPEEHVSWSEATRRMVVAHELAHIRRKDSLFLWIGELCRALFWMNPLVWIASRQARLADERAADDAVLRGGDDPHRYAELLLKLARGCVGRRDVPCAAVSAMAQASTVRRRVECILDDALNRQPPGLAARLSGAGLGAALAIAIGGAVVAKAQETAEPKSADTEVKQSESESSPDQAADDSQLILEKLRTIILPTVKFEDATLTEAITHLRVRSRELDTEETDPERKGINFIVKVPKAEADNIRVTMNLANVPLVVALKAVADLAGTRYRVEPFAVIITSFDSGNSLLYTRVYQVHPTFVNILGKGPEASAQESLGSLGISFPEGSSAYFNKSTSQLIVRNTEANLDMVESFIEMNANQVPRTLSISVEIYALRSADAVALMSEHGNNPDVADVVTKLRGSVDGDKVRLIASPHFLSRPGLAASIESGERIEYVSGYVERDGRDEPVTGTAFTGTRVEVEPIMGADGFTIDAAIAITEGIGEPRVEKRKVVAPVSGKEVEVSVVRVDQLKLDTAIALVTGQTKLVGIMNPPAHVAKDEAHAVFLRIKTMDFVK